MALVGGFGSPHHRFMLQPSCVLFIPCQTQNVSPTVCTSDVSACLCAERQDCSATIPQRPPTEGHLVHVNLSRTTSKTSTISPGWAHPVTGRESSSEAVLEIAPSLPLTFVGKDAGGREGGGGAAM